jgi:hypothetical protein
MGLRGRSYSTYAYVRGNPISRVDRLGLVDEEDDEEVEEPPLVEQITRANIDNLVQEIRQYDPGFKYATIAPANFRYGRQDIQNLQDVLAQYRTQSSCPAPGRISYGSTPGGVPFSRHYGTETGPVRNIPGSLLDQILNGVQPVSGARDTQVYYDAVNNVTVVTGTNGIVSSHVGPP